MEVNTTSLIWSSTTPLLLEMAVPAPGITGQIPVTWRSWSWLQSSTYSGTRVTAGKMGKTPNTGRKDGELMLFHIGTMMHKIEIKIITIDKFLHLERDANLSPARQNTIYH